MTMETMMLPDTMIDTEPQLTVLQLPPPPPYKRAWSLHCIDGDFVFETEGSTKFVTVADVAAAFSGQEIDSEWFPAGVVRWGQNAGGHWFVYSTPPRGRTKLLVEDHELVVPLPRLVLVGAHKGYYVFALKGEHFNPQATAYHAPFANVYDNDWGRICWGTNLPPAVHPKNARAALDLFLESGFNNHIAGNRSTKHGKNVNAMLTELSERKARNYPLDDLVGMSSTVQQVVERILRRY